MNLLLDQERERHTNKYTHKNVKHGIILNVEQSHRRNVVRCYFEFLWFEPRALTIYTAHRHIQLIRLIRTHRRTPQQNSSIHWCHAKWIEWMHTRHSCLVSAFYNTHSRTIKENTNTTISSKLKTEKKKYIK